MRKIYRILNYFICCVRKFYQEIIEIRKINEKKRKKIYSKIKLSEEDKKSIKTFYKKHYGKNISIKWHQEYYAVSGKFDYKYFPEILFIPRLEELFNSRTYSKCLQDKNILPHIIKQLDYVKMPKCIIKCSGGLLLDDNNNIINIGIAQEIINNYPSVFVKPSVDSNSGQNCRIYNKNDNNIVDIFNLYCKDFVVQELVNNNKNLSAIYPLSLNTFRITTYILDNEIYHMPIVLRIGRNGKYLDNIHSGGIFIGVNDDGKLLEFAVNEYGERFYSHPDTNLKFENYNIKNMEKLIFAAHRLQALFPKVKCIHWDMTFDSQDKVILIEANMEKGAVWLSQMAHGKSAFGDNTERILEIVKQNKKLY